MTLRELFPKARFAPPATKAEIAAVEQKLSIKLPEQIRRLYFECDGFREDRGNAKYLLSLLEEDYIGSLISINLYMWNEVKTIDLSSFMFFGYSGCDEAWGINIKKPNEIITYHHHMVDEYEIVGTDVLEVYQADYAAYNELEEKA